MSTIRVAIDRNWTHIDYTNGHKSEGVNVCIYEESHDGSNRGYEVCGWHSRSDDIRAVKRDITRKLASVGIVPFTEATYSRPYSMIRWTDDRRSYRLPLTTNVYRDGIVPTMTRLLAGVEFL
jgi:hypothetical protein